MRHLLTGCVCILSLAACNDATAPVPKQSSPQAPSVSASADDWKGHYIVVLKSGAPSSDALVHRHALSKPLTMDQRFGTVLHGFSAAIADEDIESLRSDPDVESVTQDRFVHQFGSETGMGWALDRVDQKLMPLNGAFAYGATGAGVNIYVVDGGIRYTHTEFGGRAKFAYDALGGNGSDCNGHGTGVAGIAAGSVHGVAKSATIWSVRVFPCSGTSSLSTILAGVDWVTANHKSPAVANLSLGAAAAPILDSAVERSIRSGVTYVVAAGNSTQDACLSSPGKLSDVITVGATDATDSRASWSNYGSCVTMFAPGVSVPSADYFSDVSLASWNGTSMSTPMVSGAAALYLEGHPTASPATVRSAILGNGTAIVTNLAGSANKLLYTAWIGTPPAAPVAPTPTPIASVGGVGVSYRCAAQACGFDASGSAPTGGVSSYNWSFGDGTTATGRVVAHTYATAASSYTWSLAIVATTGKKYSTSKAITPSSASGSATNTAPTITPPPAAPPSTPVPSPIAGVGGVGVSYKCVAKLCVFDASGSQPTNGVVAYYWTFGDGTTSTGRNVSHTYGSATSYTWHVSILTGTGKKYLTIKAIAPANDAGSSTNIVPYYIPPTAPPVTSFTASFTTSCTILHVCTFDATASTVPNGVSSYNWSFGDGYQGTTSKLDHSYSGKKTVTVTLKIYDKTYASRSVSKTVTVP